MTETMKKFKPPFKAGDFWVWDAAERTVALSAMIGRSKSEEKEIARLICAALNFYYAKKGEKE